MFDAYLHADWAVVPLHRYHEQPDTLQHVDWLVWLVQLDAAKVYKQIKTIQD